MALIRVNVSSLNDMWLFHGPMSAPQMGVLMRCSFMSQCQLLDVRGVPLLSSVASQIRMLKCCSF